MCGYGHVRSRVRLMRYVACDMGGIVGWGRPVVSPDAPERHRGESCCLWEMDGYAPAIGAPPVSDPISSAIQERETFGKCENARECGGKRAAQSGRLIDEKSHR